MLFFRTDNNRECVVRPKNKSKISLDFFLVLLIREKIENLIGQFCLNHNLISALGFGLV